MNNANWEHLTFFFSDFISLLEKIVKNIIARSLVLYEKILPQQMRNDREIVLFLKSPDLDKITNSLTKPTREFLRLRRRHDPPHTCSWLAEHGMVPGPGDRLHQPRHQPLDSPQQHQQGHSLLH
jgi:hypothetical protein